ncbi:hypothetical protein C8R43DRAFT_902513 [Mycena crocata]|nr:hypothetical protein C8R43DRAFT_902513 [Mycena crocata]
MRTAVDSLGSTSASFLTSSSPLKSTSVPPAFKPYTISPIKSQSRYSHLFNEAPKTTREAELMLALQESEGRDNARKRSMLEMQALTMLAGMYNERAQSQLQATEERKRRKTGNRKRGDGTAKYYSGDDFYKLCVDDEQRKLDEVAEKEKRQAGREAYAQKLATWQQANDVIRARNAERRKEFAADVAAWEVEKTAAKAAKCRPGWAKPKIADYGIEVLLPKPKKKEQEEQEDNSEDQETESGSELAED